VVALFYAFRVPGQLHVKVIRYVPKGGRFTQQGPHVTRNSGHECSLNLLPFSPLKFGLLGGRNQIGMEISVAYLVLL
ncbi:hypothetical protein, partial [Sicyoidochytrium minutum DNA virus]